MSTETPSAAAMKSEGQPTGAPTPPPHSAPPIVNPVLQKPRVKGSRGRSKKYGKSTPEDALVRPETVMGVVSYTMPRRSASRMKLTPIGRVSPQSERFFERAAQLQGALNQSRRSRTSQQTGTQSRPLRLAELKHRTGTASTNTMGGQGRPSTTLGVLKSASTSFLTGVDAGGPSEFGEHEYQAGDHTAYQKVGAPPPSQQSVSWGDLPNMSETRQERNHRLQLEREAKQRAQSPDRFPGSTLRVHQTEDYDSDMDESSADEQALDEDIMTPSSSSLIGAEEEKKYFGASGRDQLFRSYK